MPELNIFGLPVGQLPTALERTERALAFARRLDRSAELHPDDLQLMLRAFYIVRDLSDGGSLAAVWPRTEAIVAEATLRVVSEAA